MIEVPRILRLRLLYVGENPYKVKVTHSPTSARIMFDVEGVERRFYVTEESLAKLGANEVLHRLGAAVQKEEEGVSYLPLFSAVGRAR